MKLCLHPLLLLWLAAVPAVSVLGSHAAGQEELVGKSPPPPFPFWLADNLTQLCLCVIISLLLSIHLLSNQQVQTEQPLKVIPQNVNGSNITRLVFEGGLITLKEEDRQALATYPKLEELHLDGNQVTSIPAKYFSVVPRLRVLSLSGNSISR